MLLDLFILGYLVWLVGLFVNGVVNTLLYVFVIVNLVCVCCGILVICLLWWFLFVMLFGFCDWNVVVYGYLLDRVVSWFAVWFCYGFGLELTGGVELGLFYWFVLVLLVYLWIYGCLFDLIFCYLCLIWLLVCDFLFCFDGCGCLCLLLYICCGGVCLDFGVYC